MNRKKIISLLIAISIIIVSVIPFTAFAAAPKLSATSKTLYVADSYTIKVTGSGIKSKSFSSSNKKIATVTSKGVVKAVKAGSAKITTTVKYKSGKKTLTKKLTCKITVKSFVLPKLNATSKTMTAGDSFTVKATCSNLKSVTYATSNKAIASVSTKGAIKAIKAGTATITATIKYTQGGKAKTVKKTVKVTVKAKPTTTKPITTTTTTTEPVTDEDGYDNHIYKP